MKINKKLLTIILFILLFLSLEDTTKAEQTTNSATNESVNQNTVIQQAQQVHLLLEQKRAEGFDVSKAEELDNLSKKAVENGKLKESLKLINDAKSLLEKMKDLPVKEVTVELPVHSKKVYLTSSVPDFISGKDIEKFEKAFTSQNLDVKNSKIVLKLSSIPVFVEELSETKENIVYNKNTSPFGIHEPPSDNYDPRLDDLGVPWVRLSGPSGIVWDADEPEKGKSSFSRTDKIFKLYHDRKINMLVTIYSFNVWAQGGVSKSIKETKEGPMKESSVKVARLPVNIDDYKNFLTKVIERYDGDGIDDAPGSPVVNYWQIGNEPFSMDPRWEGTSKDFAYLTKISYQTIKKANPNAFVFLAGVGYPDEYHLSYIPIFNELDKMKDNPHDRYFDGFDFHWGVPYWAIKGSYSHMKDFVSDIRNKLDKEVPIWITEMSSYSGEPSNPPPGVFYKEKTETEHASDLIKCYVYPLSLGIKKIFWTTLVEWHFFGNVWVNNYWDNVGLINNPLNDGQSHKKLAYYSYKLMVEKLKGYSDIIPLNLGNGIYAYKFLKGGNSIYVLWYDQN